MIRVIHGKIELLTAFELRRQIFRVYIELSMKSARAKISDQISDFSPKFIFLKILWSTWVSNIFILLIGDDNRSRKTFLTDYFR